MQFFDRPALRRSSNYTTSGVFPKSPRNRTSGRIFEALGNARVTTPTWPKFQLPLSSAQVWSNPRFQAGRVRSDAAARRPPGAPRQGEPRDPERARRPRDAPRVVRRSRGARPAVPPPAFAQRTAPQRRRTRGPPLGHWPQRSRAGRCAARILMDGGLGEASRPSWASAPARCRASIRSEYSP